ncbi:hypothetical protein DSO57_1026831 [Entomophthora muscae]|uniref:Uncharacterized protein n=1 Tax=Entomophthora muscae TaxID=34485 RepID=A0ACC2RGM2_9FUNG|nr:hypothetical protein DSO57_1026831 [Entomophthora muscae]
MKQTPANPPGNSAINQLIRKKTKATVEKATQDIKATSVSFTIEEVVGLTEEAWEKIKSSPTVIHAKLKPASLLPNDLKTRTALKQLIKYAAVVELSYDMITQPKLNRWVLGFRFTVLRLNLATINPQNQIKVLKPINPRIHELHLVLPEPNQEVLDTLSSCFKALKVLTIVYCQESKVKTLFHTFAPFRAMKVTFQGLDVPKWATAAKNEKMITFDGIEFGTGLKKHSTARSSILTLFSSKLSKLALEAHLANVAILGFQIRNTFRKDWAIARDLKQLRGLTLDLPDVYHGYSTSGFKYPQVTSLVINNIRHVDVPFFRWIAEGFPKIRYLALNSTCPFLDFPTRKVSFKSGLPKLQHFISDVNLSPEIYMAFIRLSPDLQEMVIPAGRFRVHPAANQDHQMFVPVDSPLSVEGCFVPTK